MNVWHIQLDQNSVDLKKFLSTKYLLNTAISIVPLKPSGPIQCKNCQRFHHTASNCNMPFRCVKCIQQHGPGNCPLGTENNNDLDKIQCSNCQQFGHPSNYRGCPKAKEILSRGYTKRNSLRESNKSNDVNPTSKINPNVSFASLLKSQSHMNSEIGDVATTNPLQFLNKEIQKHYGVDWKVFSKRISDFLQIYNALDNENKKQALLEFVIGALNNFNTL